MRARYRLVLGMRKPSEQPADEAASPRKSDGTDPGASIEFGSQVQIVEQLSLSVSSACGNVQSYWNAHNPDFSAVLEPNRSANLGRVIVDSRR